MLFAMAAITACTDSGGNKSSKAFPTQPSFAPLKGGANLDQWANGTPTTAASWQNGNLNGNNSAYAEGKAVPFRLALEGLTPGTHFITIQYDFTAGGHKAYDFLASMEATELPALENLCASGGGGRSSLCGASTTGMPAPPTVSTETYVFPDDDQVVDGLTVTGAMTDDGAPRVLRIFGGSITSVSAVSHAPNNDFTGNSTGEMLVRFTTTGSAVQLVWSGHLARSSYWDGPSQPDGAGEVSGSPWHMRTLNLDGGGAANQDRSIQPSAIVENPTLTVVKTANPAGPVSVGTNIGFDITVTNNGPGSALSVVLTDTLPSGFTWQVDPPKAECSIGTGALGEKILTCNAGSLTANATYSVHITSATDDAADCKTVSNKAWAKASNAPATSDDAQVTVQCPNVSIDKTADQGTVSAGTAIGFVITVSNAAGGGTATGVVVTDNLPGTAGLTWSIDGANSSSGCSISAGVLTCNFGDIAPNTNKHVHITSPTTSASCTTINNTASYTTTNNGSGNDAASVVVQCPNLSITKTADQGTVSAGTSIGFVITVSNGAGAGTATGVTVTDNLPNTAGLSWSIDAANSSSGCSITSGVLTCNFGDIAPNTNKHVHVTSPTTSASCSTINNTASYTTSNNGSGNDDASVIVQCAALDIQKTADQGTVSAGTSIGFVISLTNMGAGTATSVQVTDDLPNNAGLNWQIDAANSDAGCSIASGKLTCNYSSLAGGASKQVHITSVTTSASCAVINNTAVVTSTNTAGDQSSASVTVQCPNLSITKTADQGTVSAGTAIGFVITVSNGAGAGTATGVTVTDNLPGTAGLNWSIDAGNSSSGCSISQGVLTCNFGDIAPNTNKHVHITSPTTSGSCSTINNTASYTTSNNGTGNDDASVIVQCPNLSIDKTADQGTVSAGSSIGFVITVANASGAGTATGVTVTDNLPGTAGLSWQIDAANSSSGCSITSGVLTCNFGDIAPNTNKHVHITSITTSASCTTINNTATYTSSNDGTGNDAASVTVQCPSLDLTKVADQTSVSAGSQIGFVLTVSNGAASGTATGVQVTDNLPTNTGLAWVVDAAGSDAGCSITNKVLTCNFGDMAPSTSKHVHVTSPTTSASCAVINNTGNATSTNGGSDEASASVTVKCPSLTIDKTADQGTVSAGTSIGFVITVANASGAGTATGVTVTDNLPGTAGLSWSIDAGNSSAGCTISLGVLTCNFGDIAPNTNKHVHITSITTSASCTTINNEASYTTSNNGSGTDDASVTVQCPTLTITKTPTATSVAPGGLAEYTIVVSNTGPGTAVNVQIADTLPAGLTWADNHTNCSMSQYGGSGPDRVLDCPRKSPDAGPSITLASGASFTVKVSTTVPSTFIQPTPGPSGTPLEIDGNLDDETGTGKAGKDWNSLTLGSPTPLPLNCTAGSLVGCKPDVPTGANDDSFGEGTKEDDTTPTVVTGSIPNNKSDLKRFYLGNERFLSNDYLSFAWERVQAPNGTTNMDIELNKLAPAAGATLSVRSANDVLIKYDLAQGGTNPVLGFHRWVASGPKSQCYSANSTPCWGALQSLAGNANVEAAINTDGVTDLIPPLQPTLDPLTFGEARINLQGAGIFPASQCVSFGAAFLKSRSSDSFTAAVKDFIAPLLISLSNCIPVDLKNTAFTRASNYQANAWVASSEAKITVTIASASTLLETINGRQLAWTTSRGGIAVGSAVATVSSIEVQARSVEGRRRSANKQPNAAATAVASGKLGRGTPMSNNQRMT